MKKYHVFETPDEVEKWVSIFYTKDQLEELNIKNDTESALAYYKGNGYRFINKCVRAGYTGKCDGIDIKSLQDLLLSKTIEDDIEVYRFVDLKEALLLWRNTCGKRIFIYPSFLSTTLLYKQYSMNAIRNNRFVVKIRISKGTPGTYLPEVNLNAPEYEILLPYHLRLKRIDWKTFEVVI